MGIREVYVKVREAATILGVAPNTVRAWGAAGKIPEYRHPANRYRLYKRSDLDRLLRQLENSLVRTPPAAMAKSAVKRPAKSARRPS